MEPRKTPEIMRDRSPELLSGAATEVENAMTKTFEFSIIASGLDPSADDFETRFFDAGCDDATVSFQKGRIIVDFAREASSIAAAIISAIECVKAAGATVERIEPDPLVNLSDIAERTGFTRAAVSQYSTGSRREAFPLPVARVTTTTPLWDWADVAVWFYRHNQLKREAAIEALAVKVANSAIGHPQFGRTLKERLKGCEAELEPAKDSARNGTAPSAAAAARTRPAASVKSRKKA
jgi:hypothetical protein